MVESFWIRKINSSFGGQVISCSPPIEHLCLREIVEEYMYLLTVSFFEGTSVLMSRSRISAFCLTLMEFSQAFFCFQTGSFLNKITYWIKAL